MTDKLLIVNADDFGITRGATDAILACHRAGSVTSTTFMSTQPGAAYAASQAEAHERLGVGLHFNLTLGTAATTSTTSSITAANGAFFDRRRLMVRAVTGRIDESDVRRELDAQYQAMRDLGLAPTHVDSHQHVHVALPIFRVVSEFSAENRLPLRLPWRWRGAASSKRLIRQVKEHVMDFGLRRCVAVKPKSVSTNAGFCSVFDLGLPADHIRLEAYQTLLTPYKEGVVELMVHPADLDAELLEKTAITAVSEVEYRLLQDQAFVAQAQDMGYRFVTYTVLRGATA